MSAKQAPVVRTMIGPMMTPMSAARIPPAPPKGILRDMFGKEGDRIGARSQVQHVSEGQPAHKTVQQVKAEHEDAEDHEIGCAVDAQNGKQHQESCGDDRNVKNASSGTCFKQAHEFMIGFQCPFSLPRTRRSRFFLPSPDFPLRIRRGKRKGENQAVTPGISKILCSSRRDRFSEKCTSPRSSVLRPYRCPCSRR